MYYHKWSHNNHLIEFKNGTWDGVERIYVDGEQKSKKFSIMGSSHRFPVGNEVGTLIVKVDPSTMTRVYLTFYIGRALVFDKVAITPTYNINILPNGHLVKGRKLLMRYEIDEAVVELETALREDPFDPEPHLFLACCYSIEEKTGKALQHVKAYLGAKPDGLNQVRNHEMLAFLRMQDEFVELYGD